MADNTSPAKFTFPKDKRRKEGEGREKERLEKERGRGESLMTGQRAGLTRENRGGGGKLVVGRCKIAGFNRA